MYLEELKLTCLQLFFPFYYYFHATGWPSIPFMMNIIWQLRKQLFWKWDPEIKPCMLPFPLPGLIMKACYPQEHDVLSDHTSTSLAICDQQCSSCTNPQNQERGSETSMVVFINWILRTTCRAEENESKRIQQVCQDGSLPHKHLLGGTVDSAPAMQPVRAGMGNGTDEGQNKWSMALDTLTKILVTKEWLLAFKKSLDFPPGQICLSSKIIKHSRH